MADEKQPATHFSADGVKTICGRTEAKIAEGDESVTCGNCLALLQKRSEASPQKTEEVFDPKAVHFSDGTKAICGATDGTAIFDKLAVKCEKCKELLLAKAQKAGDPLVRCKVLNRELNDGVDFGFYLRTEVDGKGKRKGTTYKLINNAIHMLPRSVIEHLKKIGYPYRQYKADQESGQSMIMMGKKFRFVVTELPEE